MRLLLTIIVLVTAFWQGTLQAKTCDHSLDRSKLNYPSKKSLCPDGTTFTDYFTGKTHPCEDAHIDHVLPINIAYSKGICGEKLKAFAKDKDNLKLIHKSINLEKSDKNPFLYSKRHGPEIETKVQKDVASFLRNYSGISVEELKNDAAKSQSAEIRRLWLQKTKLQDFARKHRDLRSTILTRMKSRVGKSMMRGIAASQPQAATGVLAPMAVAMIAWEVYDACQQMQDLDAMALLNSGTDVTDANNATNFKKDQEGTCGITKSEVIEKFTGVDANFAACVEARLHKVDLNPPECAKYPLNRKEYDAEEAGKVAKKSKTYD